MENVEDPTLPSPLSLHHQQQSRTGGEKVASEPTDSMGLLQVGEGSLEQIDDSSSADNKSTGDPVFSLLLALGIFLPAGHKQVETLSKLVAVPWRGTKSPSQLVP